MKDREYGVLDGLVGSIIGLFWLALVVAGVWYAWPWIKAEYVELKTARRAPISMDSSEAALGALSERVANLKEALEAQAARLHILEEKERAKSGEGFAYTASLLMLERKVSSGAPFVAELSIAMKAAATDTERAKLASLEPFAPVGIANARALYLELDNAASSIIFKAENGEAGGGFIGKALLSVRSIVKVRKLSEAEPGSPQAATNETLAALDRGYITAAMRAFEPISASAAGFWERLSNSAKVREIVEDAISGSQK